MSRAAVCACFQDHRRCARARAAEEHLAPPDVERACVLAGELRVGRARCGTFGNVEARDPMLGGLVHRDADRELRVASRLDQGNGRGVRGATREADEADRRIRGGRLLHDIDDIFGRKADKEAIRQVCLRLGRRERRGVAVDLRDDPGELLPTEYPNPARARSASRRRRDGDCDASTDEGAPEATQAAFGDVRLLGLCVLVRVHGVPL